MFWNDGNNYQTIYGITGPVLERIRKSFDTEEMFDNLPNYNLDFHQICEILTLIFLNVCGIISNYFFAEMAHPCTTTVGQHIMLKYSVINILHYKL